MFVMVFCSIGPGSHPSHLNSQPVTHPHRLRHILLSLRRANRPSRKLLSPAPLLETHATSHLARTRVGTGGIQAVHTRPPSCSLHLTTTLNSQSVTRLRLHLSIPPALYHTNTTSTPFHYDNTSRFDKLHCRQYRQHHFCRPDLRSQDFKVCFN
jgi:hypothetical protein